MPGLHHLNLTPPFPCTHRHMSSNVPYFISQSSWVCHSVTVRHTHALFCVRPTVMSCLLRLIWSCFPSLILVIISFVIVVTLVEDPVLSFDWGHLTSVFTSFPSFTTVDLIVRSQWLLETFTPHFLLSLSLPSQSVLFFLHPTFFSVFFNLLLAPLSHLLPPPASRHHFFSSWDSQPTFSRNYNRRSAAACVRARCFVRHRIRRRNRRPPALASVRVASRFDC